MIKSYVYIDEYKKVFASRVTSLEQSLFNDTLFAKIQMKTSSRVKNCERNTNL